MAEFDESKVVRAKGKFSEKENTAPDPAVSLTPDVPYVPGTLGGYSLKNFKPHGAGMEGGGFTATLYKDGKRALLVSNDGNGGPHRYVVASPTAGNGTLEDAARLGREERAAQAELEDVSRRITKADPDAKYFEPDSFVSLLLMVGDIEKHAKKVGVTYRQVVDASMPQWDYLDSNEKAILLDPEGAGR